MRLNIRCKSVRLSDELVDHVRRRLAFALTRFAHRITEVTASLAHANPGKGGGDTLCRLVVRLRPNREVTIEESDCNLFAAVARAADRAKNSVSRALKRRRDARVKRVGICPRHIA